MKSVQTKTNQVHQQSLSKVHEVIRRLQEEFRSQFAWCLDQIFLILFFSQFYTLKFMVILHLTIFSTRTIFCFPPKQSFFWQVNVSFFIQIFGHFPENIKCRSRMELIHHTPHPLIHLLWNTGIFPLVQWFNLHFLWYAFLTSFIFFFPACF